MSALPFDLQPGDRIVDRYGDSGTWHGTIPGHPAHHIVSWDRDRSIITDHSPAFWTKLATSELAAARSEKFILEQQLENRDGMLAIARAALGGLSPEAVEWAVRIAAELMAEWEEGSTHADTYYIVEAWWRSCPPKVRAQILQQGREQT